MGRGAERDGYFHQRDGPDVAQRAARGPLQVRDGHKWNNRPSPDTGRMTQPSPSAPDYTAATQLTTMIKNSELIVGRPTP